VKPFHAISPLFVYVCVCVCPRIGPDRAILDALGIGTGISCTIRGTGIGLDNVSVPQLAVNNLGDGWRRVRDFAKTSNSTSSTSVCYQPLTEFVASSEDGVQGIS